MARKAAVGFGQALSDAEAGPPWTQATIGLGPFAATGASSQPITSKPSLFQRSDTGSLHDALIFALTSLSCFHSPIGPAHTSDGYVNEERITAEVVPSRAIAAPTTYAVLVSSGRRQSS